MEPIDLFIKFPLLKRILKMRSFQYLAILPNLFIFYLFLLTGLWGTPVGNRNIIIVFVWILWWFVLISLMVPLASRIWCTACPLPVLGEWLQRLSLIRVRFKKTEQGIIQHKFFGLNKPWPKRFQNIWLQNIGFLILACLSGFLVTRPIVSVIVLGGLIIVATILALIYRYRSFCMYLCPISGFLSLYSMTSALALRARDFEKCKQHKIKECFVGSKGGYPCPWFQTPFNMQRNNYCGLCTECVKSCSLDNITLYWRSFCGDIEIKGYDEAWKSFIMLSLAFVYSINLLGPWGKLKDWINFTETGNWPGFILMSSGIILFSLVIFPGIYFLFILWSRKMSGFKDISIKTLFIKYAYIFVPFGLLAWVAFSIPLIMVNGSYIISVISDPFGWGWNIFGTRDFPWRPFLPQWVGYIQIPVLLAGLYYALAGAYRVGEKIFPGKAQVIRSIIPLGVLILGLTLGFLRLFLG